MADQIINLQKYLHFNEILNSAELVSRIILSWQKYGEVDLRTKEGQSFEECGLYDMLDSICDIVGIPKSKIKLTNNNWTEYHKEYKVVRAPFNLELMYFSEPNTYSTEYVGNKFYGMFIGRPTEARVKAMILSKRKSIPALTSFNDDLSLPYAESIVNNLIAKKYCTFDEVKNFLVQHSDVDMPMLTSIRPKDFIDNSWANAYQKIALEIVLETTTWPYSFNITEKLCRTIYYKRPFILVCARGFMSKLRELGFRTFEGIIENYYENFDYCIEQAFECLEKTYSKNFYGINPQELLNDCNADIEHNYHLLIKMANQHRELANSVRKLDFYGPQ